MCLMFFTARQNGKVFQIWVGEPDPTRSYSSQKFKEIHVENRCQCCSKLFNTCQWNWEFAYLCTDSLGDAAYLHSQRFAANGIMTSVKGRTYLQKARILMIAKSSSVSICVLLYVLVRKVIFKFSSSRYRTPSPVRYSVQPRFR